MSKMFDAYSARSIASQAAAIAAAGWTAIGTYYFDESAFKEQLTRDVAQAVSDAGLYIVSIFESGRPTSAGYFSTEQGNADAHVAIARATEAGQPGGTPIYFTVDYDAQRGDLAAIGAYFLEIRRVFAEAGVEWLFGVYGNGLVCRFCEERGYVTFTWLSGSRGWTGYADWLGHAHIVQGETTRLFGCDVDLDSTNGSAGGWKLAA